MTSKPIDTHPLDAMPASSPSSVTAPHWACGKAEEALADLRNA